MKFFPTLILILAALSATAQYYDRDTQVLLDSLDAVLERAPEFNTSKEASLQRIKDRLPYATDPEERYWIYRDIYQGYSSYDSDSALLYSSHALALARELNRELWSNEVLIRRAYIMAATGMFLDARNTLAAINVDSLTPRMFLDYWETSLFIQTHMDQYADVHNEPLPYSDTTGELLASIRCEMPVNDPDYSWLMGWQALQSSDSIANLIPVLERSMANSTYSTRSDARNAWMLSTLYKMNSDPHNQLKYLILSAMADVRGSVREIASLEELARLSYEAGDLERANNYISHCIRCANLYRNRVRIVGMANLQYEISEAYDARNLEQEAKISTYLIVLAAFSLLLTAAFVVIFVQLRRLRNRERQLDSANSELSQNVAELSDAREQLHVANLSLSKLYSSVKEDAEQLSRVNEEKEKYIADIFAICSEYISKLDEFRKRINRMIMAGRFDEVKQLTKNPELSHSELRELYSNFDRIFLQIYPDFVADFNKLLRPEEHIELKKGEMLTTDLRIYALVRLGLNDSVKISRFLHCSVQTVYNTRMKMRNKAVVPREEFAEYVRKLGTPSEPRD